MSAQLAIPTWVAPAPRAVVDCRAIAHAGVANTRPDSVYGQVAAALAWVLDDQPSEAQAYQRMIANSGEPIGNTLAWLIGMASIPPLRLPRRNADGSVVTEEQLYQEYMAEKWGEPEERNEARRKARHDAALYANLAALTPR